MDVNNFLHSYSAIHHDMILTIGSQDIPFDYFIKITIATMRKNA